MKIFLLVVTILFLINRIKTTPQQLSEKFYKKNLQKALDNLKNQRIDGIAENDMNTIMQVSFNVILFVVSFFTIIYFALVAGRFSYDTMMCVLSVTQIITVILTYRMNVGFDIATADINDKYHKFHRWYFLFNIVLDYVYYPYVIYMLLTN